MSEGTTPPRAARAFEGSEVAAPALPWPPQSGGKEWGMLTNNPLFGAGMGLMLVGAGLSIARTVSGQLFNVARKRVLSSLEITSKDPGYRWALTWIKQNAVNTNHLSLETTFKHYDNGKVHLCVRGCLPAYMMCFAWEGKGEFLVRALDRATPAAL